MHKTEWKEFLNQKGYPQHLHPFDVNSWGSAQYANARGMYYTLTHITDDIGLTEALEVLNITVKFSKINSTLWAIEQLSQTIGDPLTKIFTIEEVLRFMRMKAFDLWTAAEIVAEACFDNLLVTAPNAPGFGPEMNQLVQSDNYTTGVYCYLLKHYKFVNSDEYFKNFDT